MNSSGIKRGLASTAVAALAVTGLPFLASSASAAVNDTMSVLSQGPIRNANSAGGVVTLKSTGDDLTFGNLLVTNADYSNPVAAGAGTEINSPAFNVDVISVTLLDGDTTNGTPGDKFADGFYHYNVQTAVTLGTATKATFGLVENADGVAGVGASDPKTNVEVTPTGAPASVDVSTAQPATAAGVPATFDVVVKDAAGNVTQLVTGEGFTASSTGATFTPDGTLDATELKDGKASFGASWATGGSKTVTVTGNGTGATPATLTDSQGITVYDQATITTDEFKFDTGADTWVDGTTTFGTPTQVRVDQNSVTFSFQSKDTSTPADGPDDAGKVVLLVLDSTDGITFNGTNPATEASGNVVVPVLLDSTGKGSTTVALGGVTAGATWTFADAATSIATTTVTMARATATSVASDAGVYLTKIGSPTAVTVTVKDQFGNPIGAPAQVQIVRGTRNAASNPTARQTVDANGQATFNLPDAGTTAGSETFTINLYQDQFAGSPVLGSPFAGGTINYSADGLGSDFTVTGPGADPATTVVTPVYDATATAGVDAVSVGITGGTANAPATVSVDGDALILSGGDTTLDKGAASKTITLSNLGAGNFTVIGTKTGVVTVTIESGGRTKTAKLTIKQPAVGTALTATARNVELTGPESADAGGVATFTATVTDAFGNPVEGVAASNLAFTISGPANMQSMDSATNGAGELKYNVILTDNASSNVTVNVTGVPSANTQFGKAANSATLANDAPGLSASDNTDSFTIEDVDNIAELEAAVEAAQTLVDQRQDALANARGDLNVAKAEKKVAQRGVKQAKKALKQAKRHHKGVMAAKRELRNAKGDLQIAKAKVKSTQGKVNRAKNQLANAQERLAEAEAALEDAQND